MSTWYGSLVAAVVAIPLAVIWLFFLVCVVVFAFSASSMSLRIVAKLWRRLPGRRRKRGGEGAMAAVMIYFLKGNRHRRAARAHQVVGNWLRS